MCYEFFVWCFKISNKQINKAAVHSFSQPLGHIFVRKLDFHVRCTRVGELISVVGVAQVSPHASEFRRDVVVSVFLCNHLTKTGYKNSSDSKV